MPDPIHDLSHNFAFLTKVRYGGPIGKIAAVGAAFFVILGLALLAAWGHIVLIAGIVATAFLSLIFLVLRMEAVFKPIPRWQRWKEEKFYNTGRSS